MSFFRKQTISNLNHDFQMFQTKHLPDHTKVIAKTTEPDLDPGQHWEQVHGENHWQLDLNIPTS